MKSKKGAIEMSMNTIIIIVLGVTLLILGLVFVNTIFRDTEKLAREAFATAEKEMQVRMGSSDLIYVSGGLNWVADPGKTLIRLVAIQNFDTTVNPEGNSFTVEFQPTDGTGNSSWFKISQPGKIKVGERKTAPIEVRLPKGLPPGTSYSFSIVVKRDNIDYETQSIIVSVKEKE